MKVLHITVTDEDHRKISEAARKDIRTATGWSKHVILKKLEELDEYQTKTTPRN